MKKIASTMAGCVVGAVAIAGFASAQVHEGDIVLSVVDGRITTGAGVGAAFEQRRVFATQLGVSFPHFNDSPGFDCLPGTFPVGSRNGFRIVDALRKWDGSDFDLIPPERMELRFGTSLVRVTPETQSVVEGFTLTVASNGTWHRHYGYTLLAPASEGVYLLSMTLFSNNASIAESEPFWIVFNDGATQAEADAASAWALANLVGGGGPSCDSLDFNNDGSVFDPTDIDAFLSVFSEGPCVPETATCNDIDFNNDGSLFDPTDIDAFLSVFSEGPCL
jgi:hypothetical protein